MEPITIGIFVTLGLLSIFGIGVAVKKNNDCKNAQRENQRMRAEGDAREAELAEMRARIRNIQADRERYQTRNGVHENQAESHLAQILELTTRLADRNIEIDQLQSTITNLEQHIAEQRMNDDVSTSTLSDNRYTLQGIKAPQVQPRQRTEPSNQPQRPRG